MLAHHPTIFVIDDGISIRHILSRLFETNPVCVRAFDSLGDFQRFYSVHMISCLIMDIDLANTNSIAFQKTLSENKYSFPVIFASAHSDVAMAVQAMQNGAFYFLERPFEESLLYSLAQSALEQDRINQSKRIEFISIKARIQNLTDRELEVLQLVINHHSNKEIAQYLGVSIKTVEFHRSHMMEKMHAKSLLDLVRLTHDVLPCIFRQSEAKIS